MTKNALEKNRGRKESVQAVYAVLKVVREMELILGTYSNG